MNEVVAGKEWPAGPLRVQPSPLVNQGVCVLRLCLWISLIALDFAIAVPPTTAAADIRQWKLYRDTPSIPAIPPMLRRTGGGMQSGGIPPDLIGPLQVPIEPYRARADALEAQLHMYERLLDIARFSGDWEKMDKIMRAMNEIQQRRADVWEEYAQAELQEAIRRRQKFDQWVEQHPREFQQWLMQNAPPLTMSPPLEAPPRP